MEHLDLAGVISAPTHWSLPAFEQQDAIYLSSSRQMLEPILEETSEDEERAQHSWNQYEQGAGGSHFWNSADSDIGSIIRIEVNKDPDSISERDFACPAKRARRSDEFLIGGPTTPTSIAAAQRDSYGEEAVVLRKCQRSAEEVANSNSLERFLAYEAAARDSYGATSQSLAPPPLQRSSTGSRRFFDDFYASPDAADGQPYQSLSRSSSLIQFESLERQLLLQEQHASNSSLGNSSPSLLSFDGANTTSTGELDGAGSGRGSNSGNSSRRGSQSSLLLKRFDASEGRLHQTYFELDKLNFDDEVVALERGLFAIAGGAGGGSKTSIQALTGGEAKSDSESSSSSSSSSDSSSSGNSILSASKARPSVEDLTDSGATATACSLKPHRLGAFQRGGKNSAENLSEDSGYGEPSTLRRAKSKSIPLNFEKFCEEEEEFLQLYAGDQRRGVARVSEGEEELDEELDEEAVCESAANENTHSKNELHDDEDDDDDDCDDDCDDDDARNARLDRLDREAAADDDDAVDVDICQPKINDATFTLLESDGAIERATMIESPPPRSPRCPGINSLAAREWHSPSPDSSEASGVSSATDSSCASAASFTWLPAADRLPNFVAAGLSEFSATLRNSLPDIRGASGSHLEAFFPTYRATTDHQEHQRPATTTTASVERRAAKATTADSDDSELSTSNTDRSRSDADTGPETTPETRKRSVGVASGGARRARISSVPNELHRLGRARRRPGRHRKCSTTTATTATTSSSGEEGEEGEGEAAADEDFDFFDESRLKIRRSCSWSERRLQRSLATRTGCESGRGYMNASCQDLTQLDYTGDGSHQKRSTMEATKPAGPDYEQLICKGNFLLDELSQIYDKNVSILNDKAIATEEEPAQPEDVEQLVQRMLQGQLQPPSADEAKAEQRDGDCLDGQGNSPNYLEGEVQSVQLTIRQPPARQRHGRRSDATNSLTYELEAPQRHTPLLTSFGTYGTTTFDQDPTNLRTSYAQSLEKCNFDAKELSNSDLAAVHHHALPKRRFHSQATASKKRTLVSSTPNLNAATGGALRDDEEDMYAYVSSAHTSMHTLPQAVQPKPLGILLPAGSRTSFGKEVSFCPVVSKYCWQEQSSDECQEQQQLQRQGAAEEEDGEEEAPLGVNNSNTEDGEGKRAPRFNDEEDTGEDSDGDNADATVIFNTRENEKIAEHYKRERERESAERAAAEREFAERAAAIAQHLREQHSERASANEEHRERASANEERRERAGANEERGERTCDVEEQKTSHGREAPIETSRSAAAAAAEPAPPPSTTGAAGKEVSLKTTVVAAATTNAVEVLKRDSSTKSVASPSSTTKHATEQPQQQHRPLSIQLPILSEPPTNRAHHILYASQQLLDTIQRREREEETLTGTVAQAQSGSRDAAMSQTTLKSQSLPLPQQQQAHNNNNNDNGKTLPGKSGGGKFKADEKHPSSKGFLSRFASGFRFSLRRNKKKQQQQQLQQQQQQLQQQQQQLSAPQREPLTLTESNGSIRPARPEKPPPPPTRSSSNGTRVADYVYIPLKGPLPAAGGGAVVLEPGATSTLKVVTGKPPLPKQPPRGAANGGGGFYSPGAGAAHAPTMPGASSPRSPQQQHQLQLNGDFLDSERSYYYDDFERQLNAGMQANGCVLGAIGGTGLAEAATATPAKPARNGNHNNNNNINNNSGNQNSARIGLIETNLDTHETIITGKTRSLMDIGPRPHSSGGGGSGVRRSHGPASGHLHQHHRHQHQDIIDDDDDNDVYIVEDVLGEDGSVIVKAGPQASGGGTGVQIASVRRPHKSMEFLLDKENQKIALVSPKTTIAQ